MNVFETERQAENLERFDFDMRGHVLLLEKNAELLTVSYHVDMIVFVVSQISICEQKEYIEIKCNGAYIDKRQS